MEPRGGWYNPYMANDDVNDEARLKVELDRQLPSDHHWPHPLEPYHFVKLTPLENIVEYCYEYRLDHADFLFEVQKWSTIEPNYLHLSNPKAPTQYRDEAANWMLTLSRDFYFLPETFFMMINLFDSFLMKKGTDIGEIDIHRTREIAGGCAHIACKYVFGHRAPMARAIAARALCTTRKVIETEREILKTMKGNLGHPHVLYFLGRLTMYFGERTNLLAKAVATVAVSSYKTCHILPSVMATASIFLASYMEEIPFPLTLTKVARVPLEQIYMMAPAIASACFDELYNIQHHGNSNVFNECHIDGERILSHKSLRLMREMADRNYFCRFPFS